MRALLPPSMKEEERVLEAAMQEVYNNAEKMPKDFWRQVFAVIRRIEEIPEPKPADPKKDFRSSDERIQDLEKIIKQSLNGCIKEIGDMALILWKLRRKMGIMSFKPILSQVMNWCAWEDRILEDPELLQSLN